MEVVESVVLGHHSFVVRCEQLDGTGEVVGLRLCHPSRDVLDPGGADHHVGVDEGDHGSHGGGDSPVAGGVGPWTSSSTSNSTAG